jgi:hypothetical protein
LTNADILSILALIVAVLAMISTAWQAAIAREHNRLSVKPFLDWGRNRNHGSQLTLEFVNNGIGTAIVKKFSLTYGDGVFPIEKLELPAVIHRELGECRLFVCWRVLTPDSPVRVEEVFHIFECTPLPTDTADDQNSVIFFMDRVGVTIEYESLYGERFTLNCPQHHLAPNQGPPADG